MNEHGLKPVALVIAAALALNGLAAEAVERDPKMRRWFQYTHPCPANGAKTGPCPGWVVDHVQALACGGRDHPDNMQWQTVEAAKEKDRQELKTCR